MATLGERDSRALSVIILTRDEEDNLPACLESLRGLDAETFIVDSGSGDTTKEIAAKAGCSVVEHPFENHAKQLNWAIDNLPIATPWVMRLDADERLTSDLVDELREFLPTAPVDVNGLLVKRRVYFWGRWIRHGGYYPTWLLRVWRRGVARCEDRWMDEHMVLHSGRSARLRHDLVEENRKGLTFWTDKHNGYASREVRDLVNAASLENGPLEGQALRKRILKRSIYRRSPLFARAFAYWAYRYVLRLGFLDGVPGLVFHFLQACWYRFLVDAKLYEARHVQNG